MADSTITALAAAASATGGQEIPINDAGADKKITVNQIKTFVGVPAQKRFINSSTTTVSAGYASDTYVAGSAITITAGAWTALSQYRCQFDMTKTAAGVAPIVIIVRMGTAGTTSDAAIATITFGTQTAAIDFGIFDVFVVFRTVGSGTSAVIQAIGRISHKNAVGFDNTGSDPNAMYTVTSSGFDSTTPTIIGVSFNGGASFSGTNTLVMSALDLA